MVFVFAKNETLVAWLLLFLEFRSLKAPTQNSLARIRPPIKAIKILDSSRLNAKIKNVTSILSAIGSRTAPIIDSRLYFLARNPSQ